MPPSGGSSSTTTVQELSPEQQELLALVLPEATNISQNPPQQFPGSQITPFNPLQLLAQQLTLGQAQQGSNLSNITDSAAAGQQFLLGPALFPETNPALQQAIEAATRPITEAFSQQVLPNIRGGAVTAGQLGGSRQGIAEGLASQAAFRQIGDTAAGVANQGFQSGLDAFTRALFAAPQNAQLALLPAQLTSLVGQQQQSMEQALLTEEANKFVIDQLIPFNVAQQIAGLAFGVPGGSLTSTSSGGGSTSTAQGVLGGAAAGAALFPANPLIGGAVGALAGLLF